MTDFGYHPAVVAQKAATMQILSGGRFRLGLGAGENLNEHVVGKRWPAVGERHEMFGEAVDVISQLFEGGRGRRGARREDPPVHRRGFTEIALVQIGEEYQDAFIGWAEAELLPALRSL
jgi:alkanesulfonate monooxygenase SsuD/methylene tetrahydromethanopterin reductase-like flavin-dependent oxidoreductase (luciferase family)